MKEDKDRTLDWLVCENILELEGIAYWRRASCFHGEWETCAKDDVTPDMTEWKSDIYYCSGRGAMYVLPSPSTNIEHSFLVVHALNKLKWRIQINQKYEWNIKMPNMWGVIFWPITEEDEEDDNDNRRAVGGYSDSLPKAICIAALKTIGDV